MTAKKVWKPVEMLWNGKPFTVWREPNCVKEYPDGFNWEAADSDEDVITADEIENLYRLTLRGKTKTLVVSAMGISSAKVPKELYTAGENLGYHSDGVMKIGVKSLPIKGCCVIATKAEDKKAMNVIARASRKTKTPKAPVTEFDILPIAKTDRDFKIITLPDGTKLDLKRKKKRRQMLKHIWNELKAVDTREFAYEDMQESYKQISRGNKEVKSDRLRDDLFTGQTSDFDKLFERSDDPTKKQSYRIKVRFNQ